MADIFNEIDEELRSEQLRRLWSRYNGLIVLIAVVIVIGVAGWRGWDYWSQQTARADGDKYLAALQSSAKGDYSAAVTDLQGLAKSGTAGYELLARVRLADDLAESGNQAAAIAAFDAIASDKSVSSVFAGVARIRAAYLALDVDDRAKLEARVKPLNVAGNPWRHAAREILAFSAWKAEDIAAARALIDQIETDAETPADLTNRIAILSSVIASATKPEPVSPNPTDAVQPAAGQTPANSTAIAPAKKVE